MSYCKFLTRSYSVVYFGLNTYFDIFINYNNVIKSHSFINGVDYLCEQRQVVVTNSGFCWC